MLSLNRELNELKDNPLINCNMDTATNNIASGEANSITTGEDERLIAYKKEVLTSLYNKNLKKKSDYDIHLINKIENCFVGIDKNQRKKMTNLYELFSSSPTIVKGNDMYSLFLFCEFLMSFKYLQNKYTNPILKAVSTKIKFEMMELDIDMFHPLNLDVSFKTVIEYLKHTNTLDILNKIPQEFIYDKLVNQLTSDGGSIYQEMWRHKKEFEKQDFHQFFNPVLTFSEYSKYLVKHSSANLYASRYNKTIESSIKNHINKQKLNNASSVARRSDDKYANVVDDVLDKYQKDMCMNLTKEQTDCIHKCIHNKISVINGSAGTGKTTISIGIAKVLKKLKQPLTFLTVSAKAKDVIVNKLKIAFPEKTIEDYESVYRAEAMTIASFCAKMKFTQKNCYDNLVVDEASMIGNAMFNRFLKLPFKRLIFIGDYKQVLPVKQNGTPFISMCIDKTFANYINICSLNVVKRQINTNPLSGFIKDTVDHHSKNPTEIHIPDYTPDKTEGVYYLTMDDMNFDNEFSDFYINYIRQFPDCSNTNTACIKPAHYAITSAHIQATIFKNKNPIAVNSGVDRTKFPNVFVGSIVMRCSNTKKIYKKNKSGKIILDCQIDDEDDDSADFSVSVPNGSFGLVIGEKIINKKEMIQVRYFDIFYSYSFGELSGTCYVDTIPKHKFFYDFQLGYCQSTHKFQGSEFNNVIFNLNYNSFNSIGTKNIFYTTITRAKKLLLICGTSADRVKITSLVNSNFANPKQNIFGDDYDNNVYTSCVFEYNLIENFCMRQSPQTGCDKSGCDKSGCLIEFEE